MLRSSTRAESAAAAQAHAPPRPVSFADVFSAVDNSAPKRIIRGLWNRAVGRVGRTEISPEVEEVIGDEAVLREVMWPMVNHVHHVPVHVIHTSFRKWKLIVESFGPASVDLQFTTHDEVQKFARLCDRYFKRGETLPSVANISKYRGDPSYLTEFLTKSLPALSNLTSIVLHAMYSDEQLFHIFSKIHPHALETVETLDIGMTGLGEMAWFGLTSLFSEEHTFRSLTAIILQNYSSYKYPLNEDFVAALLRKSPRRLRTLVLNATMVTSAEHLAKLEEVICTEGEGLPYLEEVVLPAAPPGMRGAIARHFGDVRRFPRLKRIVFNEVCPDDFRRLAEVPERGWFPSLERIEFRVFEPAPETAQALAEGISHRFAFQSMRTLSFSGVPLKSRGLVAVADALKTRKLETLEELNLRGSFSINEHPATFAEKWGFDMGAIRALAAALQTDGAFPSLRSLVLSERCLDDDLAVELSRGFAKPHTLPNLKQIDLKNNKLNTRGYTALIRAFARLPAFETLRINSSFGHRRDEDFGDNVAAAIGAAMAEEGAFPSLETLELTNIGITEAGARALADGFRTPGSCPSLCFLNLSNNDLEAGGEAIPAALSNSWALPRLETIDMSRCNLPKTAVPAIVRLLQDREAVPQLYLFDLRNNSLGRNTRDIGRFFEEDMRRPEDDEIRPYLRVILYSNRVSKEEQRWLATIEAIEI